MGYPPACGYSYSSTGVHLRGVVMRIGLHVGAPSPAPLPPHSDVAVVIGMIVLTVLAVTTLAVIIVRSRRGGRFR